MRVQASRPWFAYVALMILFAFMGPYSLNRTPDAAGGQNAAAVRTAAAQSGGGVEEGARVRRVAVVLLGVFAAFTLSAVRQRRRTHHGSWETGETRASGDLRHSPLVWRSASRTRSALDPPAQRTTLSWLLAAYVAVAAASVTWADDPAFTGRRLVVFVILAFTAFVLAQAWSLRDLVYFAIVANAVPLVVALAVSLAHGEFQPFDPAYRFAGIAHPNVNGLECACLAMAAACALRLGGRRAPLLGLLVFALGLLFLTKSRTSVGALILAGAVCGMISVPRRRLLTVGLGALALVCAVVVFAPDVAGKAHEAALLERSAQSDDPATLSGRTLLWSDLLEYVGDRPALGYGFDSFWTAEHIGEVSLRRGWVIIQAHSGYVQELLDTGAVGLAILVLVLIGGLRAAWRRFRSTRSVLALYAIAMFIWYVATLVPEAVDVAHISTFLIMILLAHFALRNAAPDDDLAAVARRAPVAG